MPATLAACRSASSMIAPAANRSVSTSTGLQPVGADLAPHGADGGRGGLVLEQVAGVSHAASQGGSSSRNPAGPRPAGGEECRPERPWRTPFRSPACVASFTGRTGMIGRRSGGRRQDSAGVGVDGHTAGSAGGTYEFMSHSRFEFKDFDHTMDLCRAFTGRPVAAIWGKFHADVNEIARIKCSMRNKVNVCNRNDNLIWHHHNLAVAWGTASWDARNR